MGGVTWTWTPHWKLQHEWWVEDFKHWQDNKNEFALMLRKHPDDEMGEHFRSLIKDCDKEIKRLKKEYKKIYGVNFNMNRIKDVS